VAILFKCGCGRKLQIDDRFAGQKGRCPSCGETLDIPSGDQNAPPPAPQRSGPPPLPPEATVPDDYGSAQAAPPPQEASPPTNHGGVPLGQDLDFFAPPPPEIGELMTAYTNMRQTDEPWTPGARAGWAGVGGAIGIFIAVIVLVAARARVVAAFILFPLVLGGIGALIAWFCTGFKRFCTYVGREGVANFMCEGNRDTLTRQEVFCFRDALELRTAQTRHYYNGAYTGTAYTFTWTDISGVVRFAINGRYKNEKGLPQPTDKFHFAISAESAWTMYLIRQMEAQLQLGSAITFNISRDEWVRVSPGHLRFSFKGQLVDCPVEEIGEARVDQGMFIIKRVDAKEGWFSSQGVFKFPYNQLANAQLFLILLDKFAGVRLG